MLPIPIRSILASLVRFLCLQQYAYSGERTNSRLGTPIVSRKTTIFFVQLNIIKNNNTFQDNIMFLCFFNNRL